MAELPDSKEELIQLLKYKDAHGFGEAPRAKLDSMLVDDLAKHLSQLSQEIFNAKKSVGDKLDKLNEQLEKSREELHQSSEAAVRQTNALVGWTKWLVVATIGVAALTGGLVIVSYQQFKSSDQALQAQVQPEVGVEVNETDNGGEIILRNYGAYPVVNLSVNDESTTFLWPTSHKSPIVSITRFRTKTPGPQDKAWWHLARLSPGEMQKHSVKDVVENHFQERKLKEAAKAHGQIPGITAREKSSLYTLIHFRVTFQREVDRRTYKMTKSVVMMLDIQSGQPTLRDTKMMEYLIPNLREVLAMVSDEEHLYR
jgi:ElaB/YqjD/DUF883 family membrane-anchored ribosome-binding protein